MIWFIVAASITCLIALGTAIHGRIELIRKAKLLDVMMNKLPGEFIKFGEAQERERIIMLLEGSMFEPEPWIALIKQAD